MSNYKLPEPFKSQWIAALRSGEYKQGNSKLYNRSRNTYCCLGVAERVLGTDISEISGWAMPDGRFHKLKTTGISEATASELATMNDNGKNLQRNSRLHRTKFIIMKAILRARHFKNANFMDIDDCPMARLAKENFNCGYLSASTYRISLYRKRSGGFIKHVYFRKVYGYIEYKEDITKAEKNKFDETPIREVEFYED